MRSRHPSAPRASVRGALCAFGRERGELKSIFWGIANYVVNGPLTMVHAAAGAKLAVEGMTSYLGL